MSGVVVDNTDTPIPNAHARISGTSLEAFTNDQGQFTISGVPVGTVLLEVNGATSTRPETFPMLAFHLTTVAGQDNTVGMPIYLPPLDTAGSRVVGGDETVTLSMSGVPGLTFTIAPRSVRFKDGSRVGRVILSQVHADKVPMPPPFGTAPRLMWTLQPAGAHFDPPIRVQLPNVDSMPPGQVIEVFQFDHDLEQFVSVGPARVSEDGSVIVSDPGFGVTKSGWGGAPPPPPPKKQCLSGCDDKDPCTDDKCDNGVCVNTRVPVTVTITPPPDNPNPDDAAFATNFTFLAQRAFAAVPAADVIAAQATVNPARDTSRMQWTVTPTVGGVRSETPANRMGPAFSFVPDPGAHPAYPPNVNQPPCVVDAQGSRARSTALSYAIRAELCGGSDTNTIKQDTRDIIRQEYANHGINIPARTDLNAVVATTNPNGTVGFTVAELNNTAYSPIGLGDPGGLAQPTRNAYNTLINDDVQAIAVGTTGLDPNDVVVSPGTVIQTIGAILDTARCNGAPNPATCDDVVMGTNILAGPNGIAETTALNQVTNFGLAINSGWRNPERNEAVCGVLNSNHQLGDAVDLDVGAVAGKTSAQLFCILQTAADTVGNGFAERRSTQVDCNDATVTHVHVQR